MLTKFNLFKHYVFFPKRYINIANIEEENTGLRK